jgi:transposase-like protein
MARPSLYETEWKEKLVVIQGWARDGLTNEQISHNMGISATTLYDWQNKYPEFSEALKKGKEVVDREVENALLDNAKGYYYTEEQAIKVKSSWYVDGKKHEKEEVNVVEVRRFKPSDTTAQIFWLKNRKPSEWRDKQDVDIQGNINNPFAGLTTEELKKLVESE